MAGGGRRDAVADALEDLSGVGGLLHIDAPDASWRRHTLPGTDPYDGRYQANRVRLHRELIDEFLNRNPDVATDGLAAVVTAGPPAAGKTHRLDTLGYGPRWRRIDADELKVMLIEHDRAAGVLTVPTALVGLDLPNGRPVMPLELAGLYHHESTALADAVRERCMAAQENVIIEGTLSWDGQGPQLLTDLVGNDYEALDVVLVEAPLDQALEQALVRWWEPRETGGLGGRFTPAATIRSMYHPGGGTLCADNAHRLVADARAVHLRSDLK